MSPEYYATSFHECSKTLGCVLAFQVDGDDDDDDDDGDDDDDHSC